MTVVINQAQPVQQVGWQAEKSISISGFLDAVLGLGPQEQKSFMKFVHATFSDVLLADVDGRTMRRLSAYVGAIYEKRP